jgi:hypothetical protein
MFACYFVLVVMLLNLLLFTFIVDEVDINQLCWVWFQEATGRRINISGPLIQEQALNFAQDLGVDQFKASNGWLQSLSARQLFPPSHRFIAFTLSSKFKVFLVTDVDMMH